MKYGSHLGANFCQNLLVVFDVVVFRLHAHHVYGMTKVFTVLQMSTEICRLGITVSIFGSSLFTVFSSTVLCLCVGVRVSMGACLH